MANLFIELPLERTNGIVNFKLPFILDLPINSASPNHDYNS